MKNLKKLSLMKETVEMLDSTKMNNVVGGRSEVDEPEPSWTCTEQYHCTFTVMSYYYDCPASVSCDSDYNGECIDQPDTYDCDSPDTDGCDSVVWDCEAV